MKSPNRLFLTLAFLPTLFTTTHASTLFKPAARIVSSVAPVPTVAFGGPTPEMIACLKKTECKNAALIYHYCLEDLPPPRPDIPTSTQPILPPRTSPSGSGLLLFEHAFGGS
ncbi:hypothetical protein IFR05_013893 [Cadophora sp. M221]|nr:hypothetical protein IFR05_013893 [Cadophora sp. M221]